MAILGTILGAIGRLLNRLVNAALGWAGLLLFGKLPPLKQNVLLMVTLGSLGWVVVLIGVVVPDFGTWMLAFVPVPDFIPDWVVRQAMLVLAIAIPIAIGIALVWLTPADRRATGPALVIAALRGFPFAAAMALTVVVLAVVATVRKVMSVVHRWQQQHVVVVAQPGRYEDLVRDVEDALDQADIAVDRKPAPVVLALPAQILGRIAGTGLADLVPNRLWRVVGKDLDILVHPSDILVAGTKEQVARARAAVAIRLAWSSAYLTTDPEAQKVEDLMTRARGERGSATTSILREIDHRLERLVIPYEEWETLYRMRLQLVAEDVHAEPDVAGQGDASPLPSQSAAEPTAPVDGYGSPHRPSQQASVASWAGAVVLIALLAVDVVLSIVGMRARRAPHR